MPRGNVRHFVHLLWLALLVGCASRETTGGAGGRVAIVVPGAGGDGAWYDGLRQALRADGTAVHVHRWGSAVVFRNFSDRAVHVDAEAKLAAYLDTLTTQTRRVDIVAHSAGCGVALGAVARSRRGVDRLVLLAPSVSPAYDLRTALTRVRGTVHVFYSERDTLFLRWRTGTFGTYDRVKSPAAGFGGFDVTALDAFSASRLKQHPWRVDWRAHHNDGGHFGATAGPFVQAVIVPLLMER